MSGSAYPMMTELLERLRASRAAVRAATPNPSLL